MWDTGREEGWYQEVGEEEVPGGRRGGGVTKEERVFDIGR